MPRRLGGFRSQGRTGSAVPPVTTRVATLLLAATLGACRGRDATAGSDPSPPAGTPAPSGPGAAGAARDLSVGTSGQGNTSPSGLPTPGEGAPRMINPEPPFRYPAPLYARKVQGNVTLRLWVDSTGAVRPESTRVASPSGYPALDSSAVAGAERLRFVPAVRDGQPRATAVLFPVYFRHPEAPPLPGDSVLGRPRR